MWTEEKLNEILSTPSEALVEDMKKIEGDIMILGAGGKMGPTLALLAKNAAKQAGVDKRVYAVSRGSDPIAMKLMEDNGIDVISMNLLDKDKLYSLPDAANVIYMAGKKFGTTGNEWETWAMNSTLPAFVADKFKNSNIVVFSSGNIYPIVNLSDGPCSEKDSVGPIGEYPMSCLARERAFEYAANTFGTKVFIYRLTFAVDLRYGVLYDVANKIMNGEPISLTTPCFNYIWQGTANEIAIRGLLHAEAPAKVMNVTGPETIYIKKAAIELGKLLGKEPVFANEPGSSAYISDASESIETFGYPSVSAGTLIKWQAQYILDGGRTLDKPTHFEERKGSY